jgi:hypothetical protein
MMLPIGQYRYLSTGYILYYFFILNAKTSLGFYFYTRVSVCEKACGKNMLALLALFVGLLSNVQSDFQRFNKVFLPHYANILALTAPPFGRGLATDKKNRTLLILLNQYISCH